MFNHNYLSVEKIEKVQQVSRDSRIGIELVNISKSSEENNGDENVTAKMIVDDARDENSPMHSIIFRKTDKEAAELWREDEARRMQRAIKIVFNKERVEIDGSTTKEIIITRAFRHNSNIPRIPKNN